MKKVLINYGGAIFLYLVIFFGIVAISASVNYFNNSEGVGIVNK